MAKKKLYKESSGKGDSIGPAKGGDIFFDDETIFYGGDRNIASPHGSNWSATVHSDSEAMDRVGKSKNGG